MRTHLSFRRSWAIVTVVALTVALATVAGASTASGATSGVEAKPRKGPQPYTTREWNNLIARAKQEGQVTLYSSHLPANMQKVADAFKARYGITVNINRQIDSVLAQQVTAEYGTGNVKADIWMNSSRPYLLGALKNGWVTEVRGPAFFAKGFDRTRFAKPGKAWAVSVAVFGIGWNTQRVSRPITDYPDLVAPGVVGGRIGIPEPLLPSFVDYYLWLEQNYGKSFVTNLAKKDTTPYASTLPMQQALASGEIAAAVITPATTIDLKAQGAPVDFVIPKKGAWNAPWHGMVLTKAPHPAAAQLLANFLVTRQGQRLLNFRYGAVLQNIPGTFSVPMRIQKLSDLTPAKIGEFQEYWNSLFRK